MCQEVFLRFFTRIDELRDRNALRSFLIGICLGVAQNELRRARVRRWIFLTQTGDLPETPIATASPRCVRRWSGFTRSWPASTRRTAHCS
jgi:RNA polymerase sigma-70 factor (ECF subfamily)